LLPRHSSWIKGVGPPRKRREGGMGIEEKEKKEKG